MRSFLFVLWAFPCLALAQPVPGNVRQVGDLPLYPDFSDPGHFYYPPGRLVVATRSDGAPDVSLIQIRYTGTVATGDQGKFETRSAFSFRIVMEHRPDLSLKKVAQDLKGQVGRSVRLTPLPISGFETHLVYAPIGGDKAVLGKGEAETLGGWSPTEYWTERVVTVYPDANNSQLLWELIKKGEAAMSVAYAFVAQGVGNDGDEKSKADFTALSDSIPIIVDPKKYPQAIRQIDLNERVPANFPLLNIYCFDFKEEREGAVVERQVQIEAISVTGKTVNSLVRFRKGERDVYSAKAKFSFAVDMKKGYRYRIRDISEDGDEKVSDWTKEDSWWKMLDVTTKAGGH